MKLLNEDNLDECCLPNKLELKQTQTMKKNPGTYQYEYYLNRILHSIVTSDDVKDIYNHILVFKESNLEVTIEV